jgi:hypothetical protein
MISIKALLPVSIILWAITIFAFKNSDIGINSGSSNWTAAKLINNSFLCSQDQAENNREGSFLISCHLDSYLVTTNILHHQVQVHILLDSWDLKINQVVWQIPSI